MARVRYLLGEVGVGLRRNLLMTIATVVTVTASLAVTGAGLLITEQVDLTRRLLFAEVEVSIFLDDSISPQQRTSLERELRGNPEVENVVYESKQDAYETAQQIWANEPTMLDSVTPEILPASFRVSLYDPKRFDIVRSQYNQYPGVDSVTDQRGLLDRFFRIMDALRNGALVLALIQGAAAAALVVNTISLTAYARREQTGIMKLVGATNWYIRLPFVLEGVITGVIGALLAGGLLLLADWTVVDSLRESIQFIPFLQTGAFLVIIPLLVLIGGGVAALAAVISLQFFLDV